MTTNIIIGIGIVGFWIAIVVVCVLIHANEARAQRRLEDVKRMEEGS